MKAGEVVTFAHVEGQKTGSVPKFKRDRHASPLDTDVLTHFGTHSDEHYGKSDASAPVLDGRAEYVVVCKVIAVVRRGVTVEE